MSNQLYPYTDETPDERKVAKPPLVTRNTVGHFIFVSRDAGERGDSRNDATVFVPHNNHDDWFATLEGNPDDSARAFVIRSADEARGIIRALRVALKLAEQSKGDE